MALGALAMARVLTRSFAARQSALLQRFALAGREFPDYRFHLGQPRRLFPSERSGFAMRSACRWAMKAVSDQYAGSFTGLD